MTPDERLDEIEQGWNTPYDCRVCIGLSPSWDGHDRSCRGRVWESVPWLIGQLRDARAEVERLTHLGAVHHADVGEWRAERDTWRDRALQAEAERDQLRAEVERLHAVDFVHQGCAELRRKDNEYLIGKRDSLRAELAAERAKVERVAVIRAEWGERKADEPCHELYVALGRALAGGEQGE